MTVTILVAGADAHELRAALGGATGDRELWNVHFAADSVAALALLVEVSQVDVIVANMGPLDAAELLTAVRLLSPKTMRIISSDFADSHGLWQSVGTAHHYLTSPIEIDDLDRVINLAQNSSATDLKDPVRALIDHTDRLPTPPALFRQIVEMLESDRWTSDSVAELLSADVALTAEILKLVNSALFGYSGNVSSVSRAVSLLGVDLIRTLVLGNKIFLPHEDIESWLDLEQLDRRCKAVAVGAHALALRDNAPSSVAGTAYLTGMVNEVGLLVMARLPSVKPGVAAPLNTRLFPDVERALFGGDRFEVGGQLLQIWGFQPDVIEGILQLTSPDVVESTGNAWYLYASRRLVLDDGFDPVDLGSPVGVNQAIDDALESARQPDQPGELVSCG